MNSMKNYEFFTLDSTERIVDKEKGFMYLLIRPNRLRIRDIQKSTFLINISTIELTINLKTMKVTNNHKKLMFSDLDLSEVFKFESTKCLNELKNFSDFLIVDSNRSNKWEGGTLNSTQFKKETEKLFEFLEKTQKEELIDTALATGNKDLFDKLTS